MSTNAASAVFAVAIGQELGLPPEALALLRKMFAPRGQFKVHEIAAQATAVKSFADGERSFETVLRVKTFVLRLTELEWFGSPPSPDEVTALIESGADPTFVAALVRVGPLIQPVGS